MDRPCSNTIDELKLLLISLLVEFSSSNKPIAFHLLRHRLLKKYSELASFPEILQVIPYSNPYCETPFLSHYSSLQTPPLTL